MAYSGGRGLDRAFETALLLAVEFGRDLAAQDFCVNVNLGPDDRWERLTSDPIDIRMLEALEDSEDNVDISTAALLVSGLISCLGYLIDTDRFLTELARDERFDASARLGLIGDAAAIQSWRLNFSIPSVRARLLAAATRAMEALGTEYQAFNLDPSFAGTYASDLRTLTIISVSITADL
jgi:hypothetical protein